MKTALYDHHLALGAKMVSFAGWEMPIQYQGILAEHQTVRNAVGLFDVSHMGRIHVKGRDAEHLLDFLSTNRMTQKANGTSTYTVWCDENGKSIDDVIIYRIDQEHFFVIVNASNREKDLAHLLHYAHLLKLDVDIQPIFQNAGILALQGPAASPLLESLLPEAKSLKSMHFFPLNSHQNLFISRTGYTGAGGFEFYGPMEEIVKWWETLMDSGKEYGIQPIGLGARDTLRLEMGFALYGHELSERIAPNESVATWTIKWDKPNFLGKEALVKLEMSKSKRYAYGIRLIDQGIARQNYPIFKEDKMIGEITSGSFSPVLNACIALILVNIPLEIEEKVLVQIRQNFCRAEVVSLPFIRKKA